MAQVSKALKFRALCAQLTPTETKSFINSVIDVNGTVLFSALFHLILSSCTYKDFDADDLNRMVSNIILSRKKTPKQNATVACPKTINDLPPALVGHTASFLPQSDYIKLSTCARSLFIGCNTPNQMQELNLLKRKWKRHPIIDLAQFPSIKHLAIHFHELGKLLPKRIDLISGGASLCRELEAITLDANRRQGMHSKEIRLFREKEYINTRNITDLTLQSFGTSSVVFNVAHFHLMLASLAFDNIQCLSFHYVNCRFDPEQIKQLFPSVTALSIIAGFEADRVALIHQFAQQLKYLCMRQYKNRPHHFSTVQFDKLEQLKIVAPSFQTVHDILNTAVNLRYFGMRITFKKKKLMELKHIKQCMVELITSCKSLEYVCVKWTNLKKEWFAAICEGIEFGLFTTQHWIRDELRIKLIFECNDPIVSEEIVFIMARMVAVIQKLIINDFMFSVLIQQKDVDIPETLLPQLIANVPGDMIVGRMYLLDPDHKKQGIFINITNKECKINGSSASWMKSCKYYREC
eukprot:155719_1